jgi:predicted nucleotidyltransferase
MSETVSSTWRKAICAKLDDIAQEEGVTVLLAIESGSRAWGFHSTDSDYDVRFIYARPVDWHLQVFPGRDVIERPISDELDLSGWDLRKALGLILGSNAVVLEWLQSPISYTEMPGFRAALTGFAKSTLRRKPVMWHYRRLAERQMERQHNPDGSLRLKRYFYLIRPVLALRWIRLHPGLATPPMDMANLMAECDLPLAVQHAILDLIERKKVLTELDDIRETPVETDALIQSELAFATAELGAAVEKPPAYPNPAADALLADWTRRCDPREIGDRP